MQYTIKQGDTLSALAKQYMGNPNAWKQITGYTGDERKMPVGTVVNIPGQETMPPVQEMVKPQVLGTETATPSATIQPEATPSAQLAETKPEEVAPIVPELEKEPELQKAVENQTVGMFGGEAKPTAHFGQVDYKTWSHSGGVHRGVDFAAEEGTIVTLPGEGKWKVDEVGKGYNQGWGNSVVVQNKDTGEKIRFSHLHTPVLEAGEEVVGGTPVGLVGHTGNSFGDHTDLEYYDDKGVLKDISKSKYSKYLK